MMESALAGSLFDIGPSMSPPTMEVMPKASVTFQSMARSVPIRASSQLAVVSAITRSEVADTKRMGMPNARMRAGTTTKLPPTLK